MVFDYFVRHMNFQTVELLVLSCCCK